MQQVSRKQPDRCHMSIGTAHGKANRCRGRKQVQISSPWSDRDETGASDVPGRTGAEALLSTDHPRTDMWVQYGVPEPSLCNV